MPYFIGICGPSAAGKTYLANYIKEYFKDQVSIVSYDSYCRDYVTGAKGPVDTTKINYDSPDAYEGSLLYKDLLGAKKGKDIHTPIYDFSVRQRLKETHFVPNKPIIIVEGILVFQVKEVLPLLDLKVFITADEEIRFGRRSIRDIMERGRTLESVKKQWDSTVEPSRHLYIDTVKDVADIILYNSINQNIEELASPVIKYIKDNFKL